MISANFNPNSAEVKICSRNGLHGKPIDYDAVAIDCFSVKATTGPHFDLCKFQPKLLQSFPAFNCHFSLASWVAGIGDTDAHHRALRAVLLRVAPDLDDAAAQGGADDATIFAVLLPEPRARAEGPVDAAPCRVQTQNRDTAGAAETLMRNRDFQLASGIG